MTQQTNWLCSAMPKLAKLWESAETGKQWLLCASLIPPAEIGSPKDFRPFLRIPSGPGGKWELQAGDAGLPSRTAALRLSRRLAEYLSDDKCSEKGHISVWRSPIQAARRKQAAALLGLDSLPEMLYLSVLPVGAAELFAPAKKGQSKTAAKAPSKPAEAAMNKQAKAEIKPARKAKAPSKPAEAAEAAIPTEAQAAALAEAEAAYKAALASGATEAEAAAMAERKIAAAIEAGA